MELGVLLAGVVLVGVAREVPALLVVVLVLLGAVGDEVADLSALETRLVAPLLVYPVVVGALKATRHQTELLVPKAR